MIRRSLKWSFLLGVLVAVGLVAKKLVDGQRQAPAPSVPPTRPTPPSEPEPRSEAPKPPAKPKVAEPKAKRDPLPVVPSDEPAPDALEAAEPVPDKTGESEPVSELAPAPQPNLAAAPAPEPEPEPKTPDKPAEKTAPAKPVRRAEPLKAQRTAEKAQPPTRADRKVSLDAPPAESPSAMVSWVEPVGGACPTSHPIKVKLGSRVFRKPGTPSYDKSKPDRCYASESAARRGGFNEAQR